MSTIIKLPDYNGVQPIFDSIPREDFIKRVEEKMLESLRISHGKELKLKEMKIELTTSISHAPFIVHVRGHYKLEGDEQIHFKNVIVTYKNVGEDEFEEHVWPIFDSKLITDLYTNVYANRKKDL